MTAFSTNAKGIGGQIKRRYTDFVVEEVRPGGRVCEAKRFIEAGTHESEKVAVPERKEGFDQLHFDLEKINKDTNFVVKQLSRYLQCSRKRIGYAGMKDKRAVTCQRVSLFEPDLSRVENFWSRGIQLRNPSWEKERLDLGMLKGNRFAVKVRDIGLEGEEIGKRVKACFDEMEKEGIANFFGEQRFGGIRQITHLVGRHFVKEEFEEGVMLYLTHFVEGEEEEVKQARKRLAETNDFAEATKLFPVKFRYERAIIHHLCKFPKDFVGAFGKLPKQLRYLFTHAYQSYLFNKVIEERLGQGIGLKRIKGDILVDGFPAAPLFGFESELASGKPGEIEKHVLEEEGIALGQFRVKKMAEISSKGARKSLVLRPENLNLVGIEEDEFFPGKRTCTVSFELSKGNYATTVLREIMKVA
jgi:tRNA pseudouridine13 synthase